MAPAAKRTNRGTYNYLQEGSVQNSALMKGRQSHFVPLQAAQDYTLLRDCLKAGEYEKADDETRALLIRLAGPDAVARNWVYFTEVTPPPQPRRV